MKSTRGVPQQEELYRAFNVLWRPYTNERGNTFLERTPICSNDTCHTTLQEIGGQWFCVKCQKTIQPKKDFMSDHQAASLMWEGHQTLDWKVYSLELPPTKVSGDSEDENYWVQAKIGEKGGKRFAVIYFGERVKGRQDKVDYAQIFLDLEDEQLRFDRSNKNPMKLLCKLTAEFQNSTIIQVAKTEEGSVAELNSRQ